MSFLSLPRRVSREKKDFSFTPFSSPLYYTHTHTHSRRRGDKERQSSKCSFSLVVFSCFCAQREKKWSFAVTVCAKLDFRIFFVQQFVQSRVKLKTEESSTACVNVYKLLRRELKECCYSLLKMVMVINARVCIFFCYFCALSSSLLRSAFPFLIHFDEIRVLVFSSSSSSSNLHSHPTPVAIANARSFTIDRVT